MVYVIGDDGKPRRADKHMQNLYLNKQNDTLKSQVADLEADRDRWIAHHDNQVKMKRRTHEHNDRLAKEARDAHAEITKLKALVGEMRDMLQKAADNQDLNQGYYPWLKKAEDMVGSQ